MTAADLLRAQSLSAMLRASEPAPAEDVQVEAAEAVASSQGREEPAPRGGTEPPRAAENVTPLALSERKRADT